jgi:hypothetical protein
MNEGAIAFTTEVFMSGDKSTINTILDWLESNIKEQKLYVDNTGTSYVFGKSDLFDTYVLTGKYPIYNLTFAKNEDGSISTELYKTVSSIQL